ncbi:MAG TPA: Stk1 family PASTA domain-containing Ser/Thr kinase [Candidatus Mediterraneibacter intestinipullorum]|nr:Stk1 family PASTA domain-containing Ser/Thr kinase [Candidatus Mediterraneibacter intestinipullorum]
MIREGVYLGKRYEILGRIGSGGMADVYKGKDHKLNRYVAIKVLKSDYRTDEVFIKKFLSEAQAAAGLMHPNVVNVYDVGQDRGLYYMVMELVEGITLKDYIEKKGRLSAKETISISIQMVTGLQAAHNQHIIHRDIKPQNIIISKDGKVKVTDFGIARATTATQTISTSVMGSVHYTSPEQARGGVVDQKSDIYSIGITMYEMITGNVPFDGDSTVSVALKHLQEEIVSPAEEVPDIPYSLECIIMKCTQKNPGLRYHDCAALLLDLKRSLVDREGDFVVLGAAGGDTDRTMVMSTEELEQVQARGRNDYDDDDDYDYDDEDEEERVPVRRQSRGRKKNDVNPDTKRIMRILMIVAGVVIALLVLFLVANAAGFFSGPGLVANEEDMVEVPDVRGMTYDEAQEELRKYDLGIKRASAEEPSNEYAKGEIKSQDPGEGEKVEKNSTVTVVISSGEAAEKVQVPNVVDRSEADAERMLQDAGLKVTHGEAQYSDSIAEGNVISSNPVAGTEVDEGTSVTIVVSLGKESVKVPDIRNKSAADAEAALAAQGLTGSASQDYSDSVAAGSVISQSPEPGASVEKGSTVSYVVSLGPRTQTVEVPDVLKSYPDVAQKLMSEAGLTAAYGGEQYSDYPQGTVCRVNPEVGVKVAKGTTVYYWVSMGPQPSGGDGQDESE